MADAEMRPTAEPPLRAAPPPLPNPIVVNLNEPLRFTPKQLKVLKAQTGQSFTALFADDPFTVTAWLRLRREGWPELRYADLEDCVIEATGNMAVPDPLSGTPPTGSPPSAASGA